MNNKKIVSEIIIIPLCIMYLLYRLFINHHTLSFYTGLIITIITSISFISKYIKEVSIYENKYNKLKVLCIIYTSLLVIISILNTIIKVKILHALYIIFTFGLLTFLLVYVIYRIKEIIKNDKNISQNVISAFFSLTSFVISLLSIIIYIKS